MKTISRYIMTLALLLTAVTGAWADETLLLTIVSKDYSSFKSGNMTFDNKVIVTFTNEVYNDGDEIGWYAGGTASLLTVAGTNGYTITSCKFYTEEGQAMTGYTIAGESPSVFLSAGDVFTDNSQSESIGFPGIKKIEVYGAAAEAPITVEPGSSANTWTFSMPGSDVVLTPIYAKAAAFATTGTEPEVKTLLPEAAEGVIADTDASLIAEGTGIVAFAGTSTEVKQGTLMYAIGTSATQAPALTAFSATVPTAKNVADDGADVYVWYYIQGADAPEGQQATEENTFNDTEPACLTVTVLTNKFDITLKAANANTIEAGKATVTVGGTAATVTDGKLQGVKMGTEVKMTAKEGYKFRSVEVEKTGAVSYTLISEATTSDYGKVVCAAGHLHDAKTAVPRSCTAVGILGKVTTTGHGLILALSDATSQAWNTIDGWTSVTTYASTTLKQLPDDTARGSNLTSYSTLGSTTVSNWCVAQKSDYEAIFTNLGSTTGDSDGMTYDGNVNAYITGVGGTAITDVYWSATFFQGYMSWSFDYISWGYHNKPESLRVRPVLAF